MGGANNVLTFFCIYHAAKRYGQNKNRPLHQHTHLKIVVAIGHGLFILGQDLLIRTGEYDLLSLNTLLVLVFLSVLVSDVQDVFVARKMDLYLYLAVLVEYLLWATLTITALMSGRLAEGVLLFLAAFSRIIDMLILSL